MEGDAPRPTRDPLVTQGGEGGFDAGGFVRAEQDEVRFGGRKRGGCPEQIAASHEASLLLVRL